MIRKGGRKSGTDRNVVVVGDMPGAVQIKIDILLYEFTDIVDSVSQKRGLPKSIIRGRFVCNIVALLDSHNLFILAQPHFGIPTILYIYKPQMQVSPAQALEITKEEAGFTDPFLITFPASLLELQKEERQTSLEAIALSHIESELLRVIKTTSLIQINPIFGPASYNLDEHLIFVLMPFEDKLTRVYNDIIKPAVESIGLVCRRADDYNTNKAVMQDIWKAICEAKIVIADLTNLNPNVLYELGIAHTVGKETIMITQRNDKEFKFPSDIAHIRRIEYEDSASGGKLEKDLKETIKFILQPTIVS